MTFERLRKTTLVLTFVALAAVVAAPAAHAANPWLDGDSSWDVPPIVSGSPWIDTSSLWSYITGLFGAPAASECPEADAGCGMDPMGLTGNDAGAGLDPTGQSSGDNHAGPSIDPSG